MTKERGHKDPPWRAIQAKARRAMQIHDQMPRHMRDFGNYSQNDKEFREIFGGTDEGKTQK